MKTSSYASPLQAVRKAATLALAGAAIVHCGIASGQTGLPFAQQADPEADVLTLTAGAQLTTDSNVVRLPAGLDPAISGAKNRSDFSLKANAGVGFDRMISAQRLRADLTIDGTKYARNSDFDNIGYDGSLVLDYAIGRPIFGNVGLNIQRFEPLIQDLRTTERNQISQQRGFLNGGFRLTPAFAVIAGIDVLGRRNSVSVYAESDADITSVEAGARYSPGTGLDVDLVWRRTTGDMINLQRLSTTNGALLATPVNNDYTQNTLLARVRYQPSEASELGGEVGLARRSFDQSGDRNFNGLTAALTARWALTGAITMQARLSRDIAANDMLAVASYADVWGLQLSPRIQATGKIVVTPMYRYMNIRYVGDFNAAGETRQDHIHYLGVRADYEVRRNILANVQLYHDRRSANLANYDYSASVLSAGVQVRF